MIFGAQTHPSTLMNIIGTTINHTILIQCHFSHFLLCMPFLCTHALHTSQKSSCKAYTFSSIRISSCDGLLNLNSKASSTISYTEQSLWCILWWKMCNYRFILDDSAGDFDALSGLYEFIDGLGMITFGF